MALIGYARVSTQDQNLSLQLDALHADGCKTIYDDRASGAKANRPGLAAAIAYVRDGDVLGELCHADDRRRGWRRCSPLHNRQPVILDAPGAANWLGLTSDPAPIPRSVPAGTLVAVPPEPAAR